MLKSYLILLAVLTGCTPQIDLPYEVMNVNIDSHISELLVDSLSQWCEATNGQWCAEIVQEAAFEVRGDDHYSRHGRHPLSAGFYLTGDSHLTINTERELSDVAILHTLLHELGHIRVEDHIPDPNALMAAHNCLQWAPDGIGCIEFAQLGCIDQVSANTFCDGEGWSSCKSTCEP